MGAALTNSIPDAPDAEFVDALERGLNTAHPQRSHPPARVLGFGEISAVLAFGSAPAAEGWVFKRLPV
ncbi:MAG: hypothetical protein FJY92_11330, partial [Candidatus Hydrogenedentes bacterium]|nr:hypothetical protein [Candidatus Hydrogenedentota bacterium]